MVRVTVLAADFVAFSRTVLPLFFDELDFLLLDEEDFLPPTVIDLAAELARLRAKVVAAAVASVPRMVRLMFFFFEPLFAFSFSLAALASSFSFFSRAFSSSRACSSYWAVRTS